ncbi:MAG: DUF1015 domain-containing protein [Syntrophales bacterium]
MSLVIPFRALRPVKSAVQAVAAPPYDVLSAAEARLLAAANPLSFLHVEKSEIDVPDATGVEDRRIYERAKANLDELVHRKILRREAAPAFYLYRLRMGGHVQSGIVACASVAEYDSGLIRRHELTRPDKERERMYNIDTVGAQTGLVFLTYRGRGAIDRLSARIAAGEPEYDFTAADGVVHTVWVISDPAQVREVGEEFSRVEALYIADGHHRAAAAAGVARLRQERNPGGADTGTQQFFLAALFPQDQLRIMDYNRVVRDLNGLSPAAFLRRLRERFRVTEGFAGKSPARAHEFGMYLDGAWYHLAASAGTLINDDPIARLDVSLLQDNLLGPVLGIGDPRTDGRIEFVGGIRGMAELEKLVDRDGFSVAFSLYPPTLEQMMAVADAGKVMPPKSTWFEPKLLSGLFVHLLE